MKLQIDPEFQSLIPPISAEEAQQLEVNLVAEGRARDPLVLWNNTLLDGHHRYEICTRLNLPYTTTDIELVDRDAAKIWIIENQFGRRNLHPGVRVRLATQLEGLYRKQAKENQRKGGEEKVPQKSAEAADRSERETRAKVAKVAGVSHDTYTKGKKVLEEAPEDVKEQYLKGEIKTNTAYREHTKQGQERERAKRKPPPTPEEQTAHIREQLIAMFDSALISQDDSAFTFIKKPVTAILRQLRKDREDEKEKEARR